MAGSMLVGGMVYFPKKSRTPGLLLLLPLLGLEAHLCLGREDREERRRPEMYIHFHVVGMGQTMLCYV